MAANTPHISESANVYFDPDKLWHYMKRRNVSPITIMNELNIRPKTLGEWLTGEAAPRNIAIKQLARILNIKEQSLFSEED